MKSSSRDSTKQSLVALLFVYIFLEERIHYIQKFDLYVFMLISWSLYFHTKKLLNIIYIYTYHIYSCFKLLIDANLSSINSVLMFRFWRGMYNRYDNGVHPREPIADILNAMKDHSSSLSDHVKFLEDVSCNNKILTRAD